MQQHWVPSHSPALPQRTLYPNMLYEFGVCNFTSFNKLHVPPYKHKLRRAVVSWTAKKNKTTEQAATSLLNFQGEHS